MRHTKVLSTLFLFAAGLWALPSALRADDNSQRRQTMTITETTEIPGYVLQPGSYVVKVLDYDKEKEIVQFNNADDTQVVATVLAIRDRRARTNDGQTGFTYFQRYEGSPSALKSWYYGADEFGEVFVYPKARAVVLATVTHEEVVATPAEKPTLKAEVTVVKPAEPRKPVVVEQAAPVVQAENVPAPAPAPTSLPKAGSQLPLVGLLGLGALAGAGAIHLVRRIV